MTWLLLAKTLVSVGLWSAASGPAVYAAAHARKQRLADWAAAALCFAFAGAAAAFVMHEMWGG